MRTEFVYGHGVSPEFKWYRINDAGQEAEYFNMLLEGVKIVGVSPVMHDTKDATKEKHNHLECVELRYEKITWKYCDGNIMFTAHGMRELRREIPNISGITPPAI